MVNKMYEKITKIEEVEDKMAGYKITTSAQEISILIANFQSCCEDYGYMVSEDDLESFIGADLYSIKTVDSALTVNELSLKEYSIDQGACVFVNLETSKGTIQFTLYNQHNGYYSHDVKITSKQLNEHFHL
jgi:hypothetical protein